MNRHDKYIQHAGLHVDRALYEFVNTEALPGLDKDPDAVWHALAEVIHSMTSKNRDLLQRRAQLQHQIDEWHLNNTYEMKAYAQFLLDIGYLVPEGEDFLISTENVDPEIAVIAAPQLVVPVNNARYALNAANARWGSLYDAVYGSDMLPDKHGTLKQVGYDPVRGAAVVSYASEFLDRHFPLQEASHTDAVRYWVSSGRLAVAKENDDVTILKTPDQFVAYEGDTRHPSSIVLRNHGLHVELRFNDDHPVGKTHPAGLFDVQLEAAASVIQDCEDSVAAVDGEDKAQVYRNWLGLMKGDLSVEMEKDDKHFTRKLNPDREYLAPDGSPLTLRGRALMLVRNVGHLMTTPAVLDNEGNPVYEGLLDAFLTSLIALHDLRGNSHYRNSEYNSVYIVKPKMHGPEEVAFTCQLFSLVEDLLQLPRNTLKLGLMDEERRTTLNLKECIRQARERLIFINTGFLDRTGDEIHTDMLAGPMVRKADMKQQPWMLAYEDWNVDVGLACGLSRRAQIGKGMWAMPDEMAAMVEQKIAHPRSGASTAWVPSPTAATLHAMHYHEIDVWAEQRRLAAHRRARRSELLILPLAQPGQWSAEHIRQELDNNCQGILGYVVRWIDQGVGCSKVPDIHDTGLMEDRATLRISAQHIANWLYHGIVSEKQVMLTLRRMAQVVDQQNKGDPAYRPMAPQYQDYAFESACQLIFHGRELPSGYTEPVLHSMRLLLKQQAAGEPIQQPPVLRFA